ncbi:MAG TPA: adenosine kinase [Gammaproteobacteria bacterium]|jgi:sugar/nucleoside kinase (ribokinase family)|nr:adenosine kinase [Gammaproteobacteria bacterium]HIK71991.1 adenosine kinase [Gammaproteobacteria bacterium]
MIKIYGLGNALIDIEFNISEQDLTGVGIPKGGMKHISSKEKELLLEKFQDYEISRTPGGSIANSLSAAAIHGATASFSGSIGKDKEGIEFLKSLKGLDNFTKYSKRSTGVCIILITPDGERTMASCLDANLDLTPECLDDNKLKQSNILIFDSFAIETDNGFRTVKKSIQIANNNGVEICYGVADQSLVQLNLEKIAWLMSQNINYVYGNELEIKELTKSLPVRDLNILTTFGDKGASIGNIHVDAKPISPVNTNGAGDALIGVFLALKDKYNKKEALQRAADYATEICKINGPRMKNAT